jgi:Uma2 family endonuclease
MATTRKTGGVMPKRWSKNEYYRLGELGFFQAQRVELIEGKLMVHSSQNSLHADTLDGALDELRAVFHTGYRVRCQLPIDLGPTSEPEPDVAVVAGTRRQFQKAHPKSAVLIVEISDTTLAFDRDRKGSLYARAGVADYCIVNVVDRQVEVYRDPQPDATAPYGYRYASRTDLRPPAMINPLTLPQAVIAVADLLP